MINSLTVTERCKIYHKMVLQCIQCTKKFKYESEKKRHEQSHFPQFECQECLKKFSFLSALRRHQKQHERVGTVPCNECGRSFRDNSLLLRHIKYAHKGTHICTKCNSKFPSELALSSHLKTHKPKSERRFHCSYKGCDKSFNFIHHMKHHELTHTDIKQYHCSVCGKGFIQAHHLKSHLKSHEPENWLRCNVLNCKKSFATDYALRRHLSTHKSVADSGISSDSSNDVHPDFVKDRVLCASCGQLISNSSNVKHECLHIERQDELTVYLKSNDESDLDKMEIDKVELQNWSNDEDLVHFEIKSLENTYNTIPCEMNPNENNNSYNVNSKIIAPHEKDTSTACEVCSCRNNKCGGTNDVDKKAPTDDSASNVECRSDGTIKIKQTFDLEITDIYLPKETKKIENKFQNIVPFNSCKDILGKCIVSGNGTISEECLCAKMSMNDQEIIEQEIDEITPQPATLF